MNYHNYYYKSRIVSSFIVDAATVKISFYYFYVKYLLYISIKLLIIVNIIDRKYTIYSV